MTLAVDTPWLEGWGRWQARLAALLALPVLLTGVYCTNYVFLAADTPHRCHVPECESTASSLSLPTSAEFTPEWLPWALPKEPQYCSQRWVPIDDACVAASFDNATLMECQEFVYQHRSSIVAEFGLACEEWKRTLVGTIHNVGMLVSLPIMGHVSDSYGRRTALVVSGLGAGLVGLVKSFAPSYHWYLLAELLETVLGASVYPAAFVLRHDRMAGRTPTDLRESNSGHPFGGWSSPAVTIRLRVGLLAAGGAAGVPAVTAAGALSLAAARECAMVDHNGRLQEAADTVRRAARCNRLVVPESALDKMLASEVPAAQEAEEGLFRAFFKYAELRRRLCVCFVWWCGAVFVFYGLAVRSAALPGSRHLGYALLAAAELPALLINTAMLDRAGRRATLTAGLLVTGTALIAMTCLSPASHWTVWLFLLGKVGATMSLNALYVYSAELFPTRARHRLLAACSTAGRIGAVLAPLTPLLARAAWWAPGALFGGIPLLSALLTRLVPDTLRRPLPDTYQDLQSDSASTETRDSASVDDQLA